MKPTKICALTIKNILSYNKMYNTRMYHWA